MNEGLLISSANLNTLENNLGYLANNLQGVVGNINTVTGQVNAVESKMNNVETEMKTLGDEIREFMLETRNTTVVTNAKQNIMMLENELNKKFGHRDEVRRSILGILQSSDINFIRTSTLENMVEELMIKNPNYYLAPALIALSAWINNNRDIANKALTDAINKDDEKTSLLFCFVHKRANKNASALIWLNRYLSMQDPSKMEKKFITVMDSITSGIFGNDIKPVLLEKLNNWKVEINSRNIYIQEVKKRWKNFFIDFLDENKEYQFPYLNKFSTSYDELINMLKFSEIHKKIYTYFNDILNVNEEFGTNYNVQIDNIINNLIFNYEKDEALSRKELVKNKYIIESEGNIKIANEKFEKNSLNFEETVDLYNLLTNIVLNNEETNTLNITRKFAFSILKPIIIETYHELMEERKYQEIDILLKIDDWEGITKDGSNEIELKTSFSNKINKDTYKEVYGVKLINNKMIISILVAILISYFTIETIFIPIIVIVLALVYSSFEFYKTYKIRKINVDSVNSVKKNFSNLIGNLMAEVVDYKRFIKNNNLVYNDTINLFNALNESNYINKNNNDNSRNIIKEEKSE